MQQDVVIDERTVWTLAARLCLAAALGAVLGIEREWRQKQAGLRTNTLIAVGSALFTMVGMELGRYSGADPGRVAAQIVTGVGFLGAGAIMRTGFNVYGLTTAAMIWVNAAIGMAAGAGMVTLAAAATLVSLLVMLVMTPIDRWLAQRRPPKDHPREDPDARGWRPPAADAEDVQSDT